MDYKFPEKLTDFVMMEYLWYCPVIFSVIKNSALFFKILTAVLLGRSLVFVHRNLAIVSSFVLGFKTLLKPCLWYFGLAAVLPRGLLDMI